MACGRLCRLCSRGVLVRVGGVPNGLRNRCSGAKGCSSQISGTLRHRIGLVPSRPVLWEHQTRTQPAGLPAAGLLFNRAYKRTKESCNAVKTILPSRIALACFANRLRVASLCSYRCNRQRASLLQALARPRFVASDDCNAAPSGPLSKWDSPAGVAAARRRPREREN